MHVDLLGTVWNDYTVKWRNEPDEKYLLDGAAIRIGLSAFARCDFARDEIQMVWAPTQGYYDDCVRPRQSQPYLTPVLEYLAIVQQDPGGIFSIAGIVMCSGIEEREINERRAVAVDYLLRAIHERWSMDGYEGWASRLLECAPTCAEVMARLQNEEWFV